MSGGRQVVNIDLLSTQHHRNGVKTLGDLPLLYSDDACSDSSCGSGPTVSTCTRVSSGEVNARLLRGLFGVRG